MYEFVFSSVGGNDRWRDIISKNMVTTTDLVYDIVPYVLATTATSHSVVGRTYEYHSYTYITLYTNGTTDKHI